MRGGAEYPPRFIAACVRSFWGHHAFCFRPGFTAGGRSSRRFSALSAVLVAESRTPSARTRTPGATEYWGRYAEEFMHENASLADFISNSPELLAELPEGHMGANSKQLKVAWEQAPFLAQRRDSTVVQFDDETMEAWGRASRDVAERSAKMTKLNDDHCKTPSSKKQQQPLPWFICQQGHVPVQKKRLYAGLKKLGDFEKVATFTLSGTVTRDTTTPAAELENVIHELKRSCPYFDLKKLTAKLEEVLLLLFLARVRKQKMTPSEFRALEGEALSNGQKAFEEWQNKKSSAKLSTAGLFNFKTNKQRALLLALGSLYPLQLLNARAHEAASAEDGIAAEAQLINVGMRSDALATEYLLNRFVGMSVRRRILQAARDRSVAMEVAAAGVAAGAAGQPSSPVGAGLSVQTTTAAAATAAAARARVAAAEQQLADEQVHAQELEALKNDVCHRAEVERMRALFEGGGR